MPTTANARRQAHAAMAQAPRTVESINDPEYPAVDNSDEQKELLNMFDGAMVLYLLGSAAYTAYCIDQPFQHTHVVGMMALFHITFYTVRDHVYIKPDAEDAASGVKGTKRTSTAGKRDKNTKGK